MGTFQILPPVFSENKLHQYLGVNKPSLRFHCLKKRHKIKDKQALERTTAALHTQEGFVGVLQMKRSRTFWRIRDII